MTKFEIRNKFEIPNSKLLLLLRRFEFDHWSI
jgi:hypothetical protein